MVSFTEWIPANLRSNWTTNGGADLKASCTTSQYSGGDPAAVEELKPSIADWATGQLKPGLTTGGVLTPSVRPPGALQPFLNFSATTFISVPLAISVASNFTIEYTLRTALPTTQQHVHQALPSSLTRIENATTWTFRRDQNRTITYTIPSNMFVTIKELYVAAATNLNIDIDGVPFVADFGIAQANWTSFTIGRNGLGWIGVIRDFKVRNAAGVLTNYWPINEGTGTVINDIVGGIDGTLTLGAGAWVNP